MSTWKETFLFCFFFSFYGSIKTLFNLKPDQQVVDSKAPVS